MYPLQNLKVIIEDAKTAATNATLFGNTAAAGAIDTKGFDECLVIVQRYGGTQYVTVTGGLDILNICEAEATGTSNFATFAGGRGSAATGAAVDFLIPATLTASATVSNALAMVHVNLKARKRYLRAQIQSTAGSSGGLSNPVNIIWLLGKAEKMPSGTTDQNAAVVHKT